MASMKMLVVLAIIVAAVAPFTRATEFIVGDDLGWGFKVNYTDWAMGKDFKVGDQLVFKYASDKHNVLKIGGPGFQACDASKAIETLDTGNDVITLKAPGKKWYICGISGHCEAGMKLVINVAGEAMAPGGMAPMSPNAPTPTSTGFVAAALSSKLVVVVVMVVMAILF